MSDVQLKPWDVGYVASQSKVMTPKEAGQLGGLKHAARKAAGLPSLPPKAKSHKPGPPLTDKAKKKAENATVDNISLKKKLFLDRFIYEYLHDFNSSMAYIRAGGKPSHSTTGGPECLRTAYVQQQLRIVSEHLEEEQIVTRNEVLIGIKKEANYHGEDGSSAARVRAWGMLAKVKGMDQPVIVAPEDNRPKGGVMEIPSQVTDVEWSEMATASQGQLKIDVRK